MRWTPAEVARLEMVAAGLGALQARPAPAWPWATRGSAAPTELRRTHVVPNRSGGLSATLEEHVAALQDHLRTCLEHHPQHAEDLQRALELVEGGGLEEVVTS